MLQYPILIADIGGTNARFCILNHHDSDTHDIRQVKVENFVEFTDALADQYEKETIEAIATAIFAVAGPQVEDGYKLTNANWKLDTSLKQKLKLDRLILMNDFSAQSLAALALPQTNKLSLNSNSIVDDQPKLVIGPGTGLGVANIIRLNDENIIIPGEGGHIDIGPRTQLESEIWRFMPRKEGRVSAETLLSGSGLENLYNAIASAQNTTNLKPDAPEISKRAIEHTDEIAVEAVDMFLTLLGRVSGDLALVNLCNGGVFIAGGIPLKLPFEKLKELFLPEFYNKSPHQSILHGTAVNLLNHPVAALVGLAYFAKFYDSNHILSAIDVD